MARLARSASDGSLDSRSDSTSHPWAPPPLLLVFVATVANGVPEATEAAALCAADSLEKTAAVRQTVSNRAWCALKYASRSASLDPTPARSSCSAVAVATNCTCSSTNEDGSVSSTCFPVSAWPVTLQP